MSTFDFISHSEFRMSLDGDYAEMRACFESGAFKSVQVLAGSIVEALLVDYLLATNDPPRESRDPLRLDLAEAITICHAEGVLSERTRDLSSVVRSFRNLIHPGRLVRLDEAQPTAASANIAVSLVDLIVEEVAKRRREKFGLTAEQVLTKIERDSNSLPLLKHILTRVSVQDRERLLLKLIPDRYFHVSWTPTAEFEYGEPDELGRLRKAHRIIYNLASDPDRRKAAARFVSLLHEASGDYVEAYRRAFFAPQDLRYVDETERPIVKQSILSSVSNFIDRDSAAMIAGIGPFLDSAETSAWTDLFARTLTSDLGSEESKAELQRHFLLAFDLLPAESKGVVRKRLTSWHGVYATREQLDEAQVIEHLVKLVSEPEGPPSDDGAS
jgi:hypothetical protein